MQEQKTGVQRNISRSVPLVVYCYLGAGKLLTRTIKWAAMLLVGQHLEVM